MGPFVGWVELIGGFLLLWGLFTRLADIPLIIMIAAFISTKIPIRLGEDWWIFHVQELRRCSFWSFMDESLTDWAMLMGAGRWSLDAVLARKLENTRHQ